MVVMRLDDETAKAVDPSKGNRRKQSKPSRVSLIDATTTGDQPPSVPLAAKPEQDAALFWPAGLPNSAAMDSVASPSASLELQASQDVSVVNYPCHHCGLVFNSRPLLEQHEREIHSSSNGRAFSSAAFPTAYHRLANELLVQQEKGVEGDALEPSEDPEPADGKEKGERVSNTSASAGTGSLPSLPHMPGVFHLEAYCEICQREFCNKYFLKTHKANIHGVHGPPDNAPAVAADSSISVQAADRDRAGSAAAVVIANAAREAYSTLSGGGDICDICQKPFRNKYYIKRHKLHVHGVVTTSPVVPVISSLDFKSESPLSSQLTEIPQFADSSMPPSLAKVVLPGPAVSTPPNTLSAEGSPEASKLVGCNLCTRRFTSMHAVKIHRASAHGVYARDLVSSNLAPGLSKVQADAANIKKAFDETLVTPFKRKAAMADTTTSAFLVAPSSEKDGLALGGGDAVSMRNTSVYEPLSDRSAKRHAAGREPSSPSNEWCSTAAQQGSGQSPAVGTVLAAISDAEGSSHLETAMSVRSSSSDRPVQLLQPSAIDAAVLKVEKTTVSPPSKVCAEATTPPFPLVTGSTVNGPSNSGDLTVVNDIYKQWRWKEPANHTRVFCDICNKELCNKYFLRTHKLKTHGINVSTDSNDSMSSGVPSSSTVFNSADAAPLSPQAALAGQESTFANKRHFGMTCDTGAPLTSTRLPAEDVTAFEKEQQEDLGVDIANRTTGSSLPFANSGTDCGSLTCHKCGTRVSHPDEIGSHLCSTRKAQQQEENGRSATLATDVKLEEVHFSSLGVPQAESLGQQRRSRGGRAAAGEKLYSCSRCDYKTPWLSNIYSHEQRKHGGGSGAGGARSGTAATPHTCVVCLRTFSYEHSLMRHMTEYHGDVGGPISTIAPSATSEVPGVVPLTRRHRVRCPYCNKQFVNKYLCQSHMRHCQGAPAGTAASQAVASGVSSVVMRGGYKLYACDRCGFKCRTLTNLRMHQVIKHGMTQAMATADGQGTEVSEPRPPLSTSSPGHSSMSNGVGGAHHLADDMKSVPSSAFPYGSQRLSHSASADLPIHMQPFTIEGVSGGAEFALTTVYLPVYKKVKGSTQVTFALRSLDHF